MAKSSFAEIGEYNPRQECTLKKCIDKNGKTVREHIGEDGTSECSLEPKYGAVDPFGSMGYFTTVCRNHMEVPKKLLMSMAEMHRAFPEGNGDLSEEKSRINKQVERQLIEDPEVKRQKDLKELWDDKQPKKNETNGVQYISDIDIDDLFNS